MKICHETLLACKLINKTQYKKSLNSLEVHRRHELLNKFSISCAPSFVSDQGIPEEQKPKQNNIVALDCTSLLNGKTLLLKISLTLVARHRHINYKLTTKSSCLWIVFIVLEGSL